MSAQRSSTSQVQWLPGKNREQPPEGAVLAGYDSDRSPIFVGRCKYEGNLLPAKVIPLKSMCHTQFNGNEIPMTSYEALCSKDVSWVRFAGSIPQNALKCGRTITGESVYVGRGQYLGSLTPGRVMASEKVLYIPHSWAEHKITDFEILTDNSIAEASKISSTSSSQSPNWRQTRQDHSAPAGAVIIAKDTDGSPIYVGRVQHEGNRYVGSIIPSKMVCNTTHNGKVISKPSFETLCDVAFRWATAEDGRIPANAFEGGRTSDGERIFIGRSVQGPTLIPGMVLEREKKLRIAYGNKEVVVAKYEVLVLEQKCNKLK